ncbi:auxin-responsive protein SAUR50-like protein [Tanacetum coccineum]|uniref:Auxin-responsive protein SAUR50-like protein n=1 Tax=Tanacetum coccineum TaxID=301880 RepID=A0ABQ5EJQ3_9ASTR
MGNLKRQSLAKKNIGIFKLKLVVEKVQKGLLQAKKWAPKHTSLGPGQEMVPKDVKEGHFAVIAADDDEEKRFVVPLVYLGHPSFQRLLERAAEEYGFDHEGALMVPCRPSELECMLAQRGSSLGDDVGWSSFKTMVDSY